MTEPADSLPSGDKPQSTEENPGPEQEREDGERTITVVAVDDDQGFREMLANELGELGFAVATFADAPSVLASLETVARADVILLDWTLPNVSGMDLFRLLTRRGLTIPVVFLTGRPLVANEVLAFSKGAFDFVDKSRGFDVLVHRLRLAARTKLPHDERQRHVEHGRLVLKPRESRAFWDGVDLDLTLGEFKIVRLLIANAGRCVTYRQLYDCMHYKGFVAGHGDEGFRMNVRAAIKRVRNKFRACDPEFREIENFAAVGYVWGRAMSISP